MTRSIIYLYADAEEDCGLTVDLSTDMVDVDFKEGLDS